MNCCLMKMNKCLFVILFTILTFTGFTQSIEKWFVYNKPINGYDVKIHWLGDKSQGYWGTASFYFTKGGKTKVLTQLVDLDGWFDDETLNNSPDTIVLNQYYNKSMQSYLDWRTFVRFGDYNFDGDDELVICDSPKPWKGDVAERWLDCENYTFYKDFPEGFVQINNVPFYRLSTETCRMYYDFDLKNKTLVLVTSGGACCYTSTKYYFKEGQPYKSMEIRHEELADKVVNDTTIHIFRH